MAGRCNIDNVIQVGSCGLCAGLSYTAYCYGIGSHHTDSDGMALVILVNGLVFLRLLLKITQALSDFPTAVQCLVVLVQHIRMVILNLEGLDMNGRWHIYLWDVK